MPGQDNKLTYEKHLLQVNERDTLAIHRFYNHIGGTPVMMIHGAIEDGKIFYSKKNQKGIGPYLARHGYDVFIVDMRGKGESFPKIDKHLTQTQKDAITIDIPSCISFIKNKAGQNKIHGMAHSWGGVWLYALVGRLGHADDFKSFVMFGSKRRVSVFPIKRFIHLDLVWNFWGRFMCLVYGYAKFKKGVIGSEYEPKHTFLGMNQWVYTKKWISREDKYDYHKAFKNTIMPPTLHLTGIKDKVLGNPVDIEKLFTEVGKHKDLEFFILGKNYENLHDYNHIDILTNKLAEEDVYPIALEWLNRFDEREEKIID